jgi:hypothetical protein
MLSLLLRAQEVRRQELPLLYLRRDEVGHSLSFLLLAVVEHLDHSFVASLLFFMLQQLRADTAPALILCRRFIDLELGLAR